MRASIKWLKDYVEFSEPPELLADKLTMAGVPVAAIDFLGRGIEWVVTGKIAEVRPHPNADKLSVCIVDTGDRRHTVVTGATNVRQGNIVPLALVGAKLPGGIDIGLAEFRGVESQGMMCSADELNLESKILPPEAREGIIILPDDTPIGVDIKSILGLDDTILEFELTANRADCFSMIGLAREIAAITGGTLRKPMLNLKEGGREKAAALAEVSILEPSLCARFTARVLQDVKVGPSPLWLQHRLQAAGMRPINNVVDVTNFVMLELGQPMHAYDYSLLSRHKIIVRRANPGERITTLDGVKRELTPDMLVIADAVQAIGIAGVMGGLATEVTDNTQQVLLEAASFNGVNIRRTSRALGLRSEASGRFERGVDTANIIRALDRAAQLLEDMGACRVCPGIIDVYPGIALPKQFSFVPADINTYLGADISSQTMINILKRLEFDVESAVDKITVTVPTWRSDVTGPADISEEIARLYGYDNIPSTVPQGAMTQGRQSYQQDIADRLKASLSAFGFDEVITYSFTHPQTMDKLNFSEDSKARKAIRLLNPITDDFPLLRTSLMGGIMETIVNNLARKNDNLKIFELGAVYLPEKLPLEKLPDEPIMLCGGMVGRRNPVSWSQSSELVDFYDAKGAVEELLESIGIKNYEVKAGEHSALHPGKTAAFIVDDEVLGVVGEAHPKVLTAFNLTRKVYLFELYVERLAKYSCLIGQYVPLPKFPSINRDLAVVLPESIPADAVAMAITDSAGPLLADLSLFDVYSGEQVAKGSRSLAFSLTFRASDRTLTDNEVDEYYKGIVAHLESTMSAKLRM